MRHAQLAEAEPVGEIGDRVHLIGSRIAWRYAGLLERKRHGSIPGNLVRMHVAAGPGGKPLVTSDRQNIAARKEFELFIGRPCKPSCDARDLTFRERRWPVLAVMPLRFDRVAEPCGREVLHQDLDPRLPFVVAPPVTVMTRAGSLRDT